MCNVDFGKHRDRIKAAYEASVFTEAIRPEPEENIKSLKQIMPPYHQSTAGYYLTQAVAIWQNHGFLT